MAVAEPDVTGRSGTRADQTGARLGSTLDVRQTARELDDVMAPYVVRRMRARRVLSP
ncbi:hypothetical protein [Streptomyces phaeofaciens]|uniref:hypothetical protein n=1 Tax=Streptomyces phaeofaciens TaxID=68254 RepID=UPI00167926C3|nr:hypothetical protein [Streptomyces phaeofaciens]